MLPIVSLFVSWDGFHTVQRRLPHMQEFAVVKNTEMQALFRTMESNEKVWGGFDTENA
jgi:hypothetical protein